MTPIIYVNPSCDGFTNFIPPDGPRPTGLLDAYRERGFVQPGQAIIGDAAAAAAAGITYQQTDSNTITVRDGTFGTDWDISSGGDQLQGLITEAGGFLLTLTYRHWLPEVTTPEDFRRLRADAAGSVDMWVPRSAQEFANTTKTE